VLLVINVFLLFVGCFQSASALIMLTPLLAPVAASLGINQFIWVSSWC
jgi:TRAP-type C4-dicarboxylate transport system permease large subunit